MCGQINKQEAFVQVLIRGVNQREAYKSSHDTSWMKGKTMTRCAMHIKTIGSARR